MMEGRLDYGQRDKFHPPRQVWLKSKTVKQGAADTTSVIRDALQSQTVLKSITLEHLAALEVLRREQFTTCLTTACLQDREWEKLSAFQKVGDKTYSVVGNQPVGTTPHGWRCALLIPVQG